MKLNTNNKQLPFQYKPKTNEYVLETIIDTMILSTDNIRLKYYEGEDLFCVDVGYSIDGDVSKMSFKIDDLIVYPVVLKTPDKLQQQVINNQAIYIISEDYNFKSIIFIPIAQLNKTFEYTITSYNSCISSFVVDAIGRKFNSDAIYAEATQVSQTNEALGDNVQVALDTIKNNFDNLQATQVTQTNEALGDNVQTALDKLKTENEYLLNIISELNSRYMIPCYYEQYPLEDGTFDENEEPSVWFKKMYNVNTTWQIIFNSESVYFRTEGDLANVERSNGIQNDAGRNATGYINSGLYGGFTILRGASGIFYINGQFPVSSGSNSGLYGYKNINMDLSRAYGIANEFRVRNRLMRIYKLLTINDKSVNEIMEEF